MSENADNITIKMGHRVTLEEAWAYIQEQGIGLPKPCGLTGLINALPDGWYIVFPRITETYPDLNWKPKE
jgi:hypothetical protein